jgi:hypothetical protein
MYGLINTFFLNIATRRKLMQINLGERSDYRTIHPLNILFMVRMECMVLCTAAEYSCKCQEYFLCLSVAEKWLQ